METNLPKISSRYRKWVFGLIASVASVIGWGPTNDAIRAIYAYVEQNPLPANEVVIEQGETGAVVVVVVTNVPTPSLDAIDVYKVRIVGKHRMDPSKATIAANLKSASIQGSGVRLDFDPFDWPKQEGKKTTDGGVCMLWVNEGGYIGGFFDHHGVGQTFKTTANIGGGYVDGEQPKKGEPVWVYLISYDGKKRTRIVPAGKW